MTISVHDLPPGNRPVDVVASNRQLPSLVPHKRELHKVSQPIEQAPQKYFFSVLFLPFDEMYQGRHGQLLEPALSELWSGGDGVHLNVGGQGVPFLRNAGYNSDICLLCAVIYFCLLHSILTQMILSNPIFASFLSSTLRRICLSGPRGIQASLTPGNHNSTKLELIAISSWWRGEKCLLSNIWSGRPPACRFTWWSTLWRRRGRVPISFPQGGLQSEKMATNKIRMIVLAHPIIQTLMLNNTGQIISGQLRRSTWSTTTNPTSPAKRTLIADSLKSIFFKNSGQTGECGFLFLQLQERNFKIIAL